MAAFAAHVQLRTLEQWVRRGHISAPNANGNYDLVEIFRYQREGSAARHARAVAARRRRGETRCRQVLVASTADGL